MKCRMLRAEILRTNRLLDKYENYDSCIGKINIGRYIAIFGTDDEVSKKLCSKRWLYSVAHKTQARYQKQNVVV